jgi:hypothetical protein
LNNVKNHGISKSGGGSKVGFSIQNFEKQHRSAQGHVDNCKACVILLLCRLNPSFSTRHIRAFAAQPTNVDDLPADNRPLPSDPAARIQALADLELLAEFTTNVQKMTVKCSVCVPPLTYDLAATNIIGSLRHHRVSLGHVKALQLSEGQTTLFSSISSSSSSSVVMPPSSSRRR